LLFSPLSSWEISKTNLFTSCANISSKVVVTFEAGTCLPELI
jgi:hypothetical protein